MKRDGCKPLIVGVYVDDLVVAHDSSTPKVFDEFISAFTKHFNAKHEGRLRWFLGMAVDCRNYALPAYAHTSLTHLVV